MIQPIRLATMKTILLLSLIIFSGCLKQTTNSVSRMPSSELGTSTLSETAAPDVTVSTLEPSNPLPGLPSNQGLFSSQCQNILTPEGNPGPAGRELLKAMKDVEADSGKPCFSEGGDNSLRLGGYCKGTEHFQSLTTAQKENLWLWFWASLSQRETNCRNDAVYAYSDNSPQPREHVYNGLFLLGRHQRDRFYDNRTFCGQSTDTTSYRFQARCSASRLADHFCGPGISSGNTNKSGRTIRQSSYGWEVLNPRYKNRKIGNLMKLHPLCQ